MAAQKILDQIGSVFSRQPSTTDPCDVLVNEISLAAKSQKRVFVYGVGREGLMLRALCMRLYHLGLHAHAVGDVTTPPAAGGDLLVASAGPGGFSTVDALCGVAKRAGARVVLLTARPGAGTVEADAVAHLPARTMADDEEDSSGSVGGDGGGDDSGTKWALPMGSLYEGAMFVLFEMVVLRLAKILEQSPADLRSRHTNLE